MLHRSSIRGFESARQSWEIAPKWLTIAHIRLTSDFIRVQHGRDPRYARSPVQACFWARVPQSVSPVQRRAENLQFSLRWTARNADGSDFSANWIRARRCCASWSKLMARQAMTSVPKSRLASVGTLVGTAEDIQWKSGELPKYKNVYIRWVVGLHRT